MITDNNQSMYFFRNPWSEFFLNDYRSVKNRNMVELLNNFPPHVAAYKAYGNVDKNEYEKVVMKRVNEVADRYGKINFLVCLETDFENYSFSAFLDYLKISFEHFFKWE